MNKKTITIGIPAYNEEANIRSLLTDLEGQKLINFDLKKIIVISDASTDNTNLEVNKIKTSKIKLSVNKKRLGLYKTQNKIFKLSNTDVLIMLNADIRIKDKYFIEKIAKIIIKEKADLVSPDVLEMVGETFFEKILYISTKIKNDAFKKYNQGNNVYTCRGIARGFSKKLYSNLRFTNSIGEDAYSYFYCISNNYKYVFTDITNVIFKLPVTFIDHKNQSKRFFESQKILKKQFNKTFITNSYKLPKYRLIRSLIVSFTQEPIYLVSYFLVLIFIKSQTIFNRKLNDNWIIAKTSKKINI